MTFNTLRDRLLLRLLSKSSREALETVVFYNIEDEIKDYVCSDNPDHIAPALTHLADLMEEKPQWTAQFTESF